jgi:hypothetical protein
MPTRGDVERKAREYLWTPFAHQGRIKGRRGRLDCVGLALCVADELGILDRHGVPLLRWDHANYAMQPLGEEILQICLDRLIEKPRTAAGELPRILAGDVLIMRVPSVLSHAAIASTVHGALGIIHGYGGGTRLTVEHRVDHKWMRRIDSVFEFPGVTD